MKTLVRHFGKVDDNCKLHYGSDYLWKQQLEQLRGQDVEILIKKRSKKNTSSQYGYYRGGILNTCFESEMFKGSFNKADDIHDEYFAPLFLSFTKMITVGGKTKEQVFTRSMSELNREETSQFIERVIAHCESELGLTILSPDQYYNKHYNIF